MIPQASLLTRPPQTLLMMLIPQALLSTWPPQGMLMTRSPQALLLAMPPQRMLMAIMMIWRMLLVVVAAKSTNPERRAIMAGRRSGPAARLAVPEN